MWFSHTDSGTLRGALEKTILELRLGQPARNARLDKGEAEAAAETASQKPVT